MKEATGLGCIEPGQAPSRAEVVVLAVPDQAPGFLWPESLANIVKQASFIGSAAIGITFVPPTRGIDLSVGSVT